MTHRLSLATCRSSRHRERRPHRPARCVLLSLLAASCAAPPPPPSEATSPPLSLLQVRAPDPATVGSPLLVRATGVDPSLTPWLFVRPADRDEGVTLDPVEAEGARMRFALSQELFDLAGEGFVRLLFFLQDGERRSDPFPLDVVLRSTLAPRLQTVPGGDVHRNQLLVLRGSELLLSGEGEASLEVRGAFHPDDGSAERPVDVRLALHPLEPLDRSRVLAVLGTRIGDTVQPGTFDGEARLRWRQDSGAEGSGGSFPVRWTFQPPALYALEPSSAPLERYVEVRGAGFVGGEEASDEVTILRIEGTFTEPGGAPRAFGPTDLVPRFLDGERLLASMRAVPRSGQLISELFGAPQGRFDGTMTPITIKGLEEVSGPPIRGSFTLEPVVQVLWVRFLPGFEQSLERFGLRAARERIESLVAERIRRIYEAWRVDVRLQQPEDYSPNGYAILDIGGQDPNGLGLFGYDNTPGKDVGNLRLHDRIGGANAETQEGGFPGYGGVFVDNYLYFSRRPGLPGDRPAGAPDPDPLFDEVFDPVRRQPATSEEVEGRGADPMRLQRVDRAVRALASMVGETAAHEFGHSLGLADPYGPPSAYHNPGDQPGCLMDSGSARPFGERAELPGFEPSHLCGDHVAYLDEILGGP